MEIAFFGSSLVSAYWNGAATYYRGLLRALHERGFRTTFYEPDAYERQQHRDIPDPPWANVRVYAPTRAGVDAALDAASEADLVVKASGVGIFDEYLERNVLALRNPATLIAFWDVDAPATLTRLAQDPSDPFGELVERYDIVFTYGGGPPVVNGYLQLGARACVPIYNALDPTTHHPVAPTAEYRSTLSFLGNRLPDRELRVREFFLKPAQLLPQESFLIGGNGWEAHELPDNVRRLGHVYTGDHNKLYASALGVLNVSRQSMADFGYSPATRVFEAAGAGACLISDEWIGIEDFLEPDREVLLANSGDQVAAHLRALDPARARNIGQRALRRVLSEHTYAHRALEVERALGAQSGSDKIQRRPSMTEAEHPLETLDSGVSLGTEATSLNILMLGLSITSSWGNGHATTYRALVRELSRLGHRVLFLERDVPWYAAERDLPNPPYCRTELYESLSDLRQRFGSEVAQADLVMVGSFVPEGSLVGQWAIESAGGVTVFYDIDTPVTLSQLEDQTCEHISRDLIPRYDLYLSFAGGPLLDALERDWGARSALPLYCSVDPESYYPEPCEQRWDLGYMGTYSPDRRAGLEQLLIGPAARWQAGRFALAGSSYPDDIRWPASVERLGHLPPARHREFYNQQRFTLNLTRRDMARAGFAPSVRLFEAAASGTPVITDRWSGLSEFFTPAREILVVDATEQVLDVLKGLSEQRRQEIGEAARARVMQDHTAARRARTLVEYARRAAADQGAIAKARTA